MSKVREVKRESSGISVSKRCIKVGTKTYSLIVLSIYEVTLYTIASDWWCSSILT